MTDSQPAALLGDFRKLIAALRRRIVPIHLPPTALLPPLERTAFESYVSSAKLLLEYGAGGSTLCALGLGKSVVSVDNDPQVFSAIRSHPAVSSRFTPILVDIGLSEEYGVPLFKRPTRRRISSWRRYPEAPWDALECRGLVPDLIYVDGRFRVACVLESLLRLPPGNDPNIIMDDYSDRDHYSAVLPFVSPPQRLGRLAIFKKRPDGFDEALCRRVKEAHLGDWR